MCNACPLREWAIGTMSLRGLGVLRNDLLPPAPLETEGCCAIEDNSGFLVDSFTSEKDIWPYAICPEDEEVIIVVVVAIQWSSLGADANY